MAGLIPISDNSLIRHDRACPGHPRRAVIDPREVCRGRPTPPSGLHPGTVAYTTTWMTGTSPVMTTLAVLSQRIWGGRPGHDGDLQAFLPSISKSRPFFAKLFQKFLWWFCGISMGCKASVPKKSFSKFLTANAAPLAERRCRKTCRFRASTRRNPRDRRPRLPRRSESPSCVAKAVRIVARS